MRRGVFDMAAGRRAAGCGSLGPPAVGRQIDPNTVGRWRVLEGLDEPRIVTASSPGPGPGPTERAPCSSAWPAVPRHPSRPGETPRIVSEPREVWRGCTRTVHCPVATATRSSSSHPANRPSTPARDSSTTHNAVRPVERRRSGLARPRVPASSTPRSVGRAAARPSCRSLHAAIDRCTAARASTRSEREPWGHHRRTPESHGLTEQSRHNLGTGTHSTYPTCAWPASRACRVGSARGAKFPRTWGQVRARQVVA